MKFFTILFCLFTSISHAATRTWDGGGSTNNWSDAANWDCNCLPAAGDDTAIPLSFVTTTINIDVNVAVASIHSNANIVVNPGVSVTLTGDITMSNGADLSINTSASISAVHMVLRSVSDNSGQIWDNTVSNHGTINLTNSINMVETCDAGFPCGTTLTNNGNITINGYGIFFEDHTKLINNNSMVVNGSIGINLSILNQNSLFYNYGTFSSNTINYFNNATNGPAGNMIFNNYINEIDPITSVYTASFVCLKTFTNSGTITMSNPQGNAHYGIQVKNGATFNSVGTLNLTAQRHPLSIEPGGTANISGTSSFNAVQVVYQSGILNAANLNISNSSTTFTSTTNLRNLTGGIVTISDCKQVNLLTLYNQGTTTNHGHITFDPLNTTSTSLTQLGTLTNHGVMVNCAFPVTLSNAENPGLFAQRVMNLRCTNYIISDFISGVKTGISNAPTSGIFTDMALSTSAGTLNWAANTFTPNSSAVGATVLYIQITKGSCAPKVIPVYFQQPITSDIWYRDMDGDGWGNPANSTNHCGTFLVGYTQNVPDCNDNNEHVYPGAPENCNDQDYNCDGIVNPGLPAPPIWYKDMDGDGFGNVAMPIASCSMPTGYVSNSTDCNDNNNQIFPGALEVCDNLDNNCNGSVDEGIPTGTCIFTNGSGNGQWTTSTNWNLGFVPLPCFNAVIPGGVVNINGSAQCKSLSIAPGAILNIQNGSSLTVMGSTTNGIANNGVINISPGASINISNATSHGIDNNGAINTPVTAGSCSITINYTGQNGIQNNPSRTFVCNMNTNIMLTNIGNRGVSNNGTFTFKGFLAGFNVLQSMIYNTGTFTNNGALDFQNGTQLPEWNIYNQGTFNNAAPSGFINLATPSVGANVSNKGIYNQAGATLNNYGNINAHGNTIAGSGALINHAGSTFTGGI
jgi:hypothetical protein